MIEERELGGVDAPESTAPSGSRPLAVWAGRGPRGLAFAALTLIGGSIAVMVLQGRESDGAHYRAVEMAPSAQQTADDPLMGELVRCRALPPQVSDPACERAWDENRRRFFGETRATRMPGDPRPRSAPIPAPASEPIASPPSSPTPKDT